MWILFLLCVPLVTANGPCATKNAELQKMVDDAMDKGNPVMDVPIYKCDEDGFYEKVQCYGAEMYCFCASKTGETIENYNNNYDNFAIKKMTCNCARDKHEYHQKGLLGRTYKCDPLGNYEPIQCLGSVCYCADEKGRVTENSVPIGKIATLKCD